MVETIFMAEAAGCGLGLITLDFEDRFLWASASGEGHFAGVKASNFPVFYFKYVKLIQGRKLSEEDSASPFFIFGRNIRIIEITITARLKICGQRKPKR